MGVRSEFKENLSLKEIFLGTSQFGCKDPALSPPRHPALSPTPRFLTPPPEGQEILGVAIHLAATGDQAGLGRKAASMDDVDVRFAHLCFRIQLSGWKAQMSVLRVAAF